MRLCAGVVVRTVTSGQTGSQIKYQLGSLWILWLPPAVLKLATFPGVHPSCPMTVRIVSSSPMTLDKVDVGVENRRMD